MMKSLSTTTTKRGALAALCCALASVGCSVLFDAEPPSAESDAAVIRIDADRDLDAGTPRIPVDEQFAGCGEPLAGFQHRVQVAIDYDYSVPLAGFPLLVTIPPDVLASLGLREDASDLRFTSGAGESLSFEIEVLDPEGMSYVWVRTDVSRSVCGRSIWMYGGGPEGLNTIAKTWEEAVAVWHFSDEGDAQSNSVPGAAAAEKQGRQASLSVTGDGAVGRAQRNSRFHVPTDNVQAFGGDTTWESRFYVRNPEAANQRSLDFGGHLTLISTRDSSQDDYRLPAVFADGGPNSVFLSGNTETTAGWHYMAVTLETTDNIGTVVTLYYDGQEVPLPIEERVIVALDTNIGEDPFRLGLHDGDIDEVRVWSVARQAEWIELTHRCFEGGVVQFSETVSLAP